MDHIDMLLIDESLREFLTVDSDVLYSRINNDNKDINTDKKTNEIGIQSEIDIENENGDEKKETLSKELYDILVIKKNVIKVFKYTTFPRNYCESLYRLLKDELSEPYNIFLLKTILNNYSDITLICLLNESCVGAIINKINLKKDLSYQFRNQGYICMIAVHKSLQRKGLGTYLLTESIKLMKESYNITEVLLETEATNEKTLNFYEKNGFIRIKRKPHFYLNGLDVFKLKKII